MKSCYSCGIPLMGPEEEKARGSYCQHCSDEQGNVLSFEQVKQGIACYLKTWQPDLDDQKALTRAEFYMKAMPAWAD